MSFLIDDTISLEDARASLDAATAVSAQEAVYIATSESEKRAVWDSIITYAVIAYAMSHGSVMMRGTTFFSVLAVFVGVFLVTVNFKATMSSLLAVPGSEKRGRSFMELLSRLLSLVLAYVQFLLVQIVTSRSNVFISDGHFSLESLVLPIVLFALFYVYTHMQSMRHRTPTILTSGLGS